MYGQGNYPSQLRHGPPAPPRPPTPQALPPFQLPPIGGPTGFQHHGNQQVLQPPSQQHVYPPPFSVQGARPPPNMPVNMSQPFGLQPPPSYVQAGPGILLPEHMTSQTANLLQAMPQPPRLFAPLPAQGQNLYRGPPLPPAQLQHMSGPPPPLPPNSTFVPMTPMPFNSSGNMALGEAENLVLAPPPPPPPLPPSSPPPLPPSPPPSPPPAHPLVDSNAVLRSLINETGTKEHASADTRSSTAHNVKIHGTYLDGGASLAKEISSKDLPSPPPKPVEEVVHEIELVCRCIAEQGPQYEDVLRGKDPGNPKLAFLYGGKPGSPAAIGYEYFQWMKKYYSLRVRLYKEDEQGFTSSEPSELVSPNIQNEGTVCSPASSDMDMDDDKDSSFIEDVSPIRTSSGVVELLGDGKIQNPVRLLSGNSTLLKIPSAQGCEISGDQKVLGGDGSPLWHIQGYASDDSEENDKKCPDNHLTPANATESVAVSLSSMAKDDNNQSSLDLGPSHEQIKKDELSHQLHSVQPSTDICGISSLQHSSSSCRTYPFTNKDNLGDEAANLVSCENEDITKYDANQSVEVKVGHVKQDSVGQKVDEFGRLVREGVSDSDSDDMQYDEKRGSDKGKRRSHSRSPQEGRYSRRSHSPRRRMKRSRSRSWSPRQRSKSPRAFSRNNLSSRRDEDRPSQCLNFVRGRCFRGATCRFLHRDVGHNKIRHQHYQGSRKDSGKHEMNDWAPSHSSKRNFNTTKSDIEAMNNVQEKKKMHALDEHPKPSSMRSNDGVTENTFYQSVTEDVLPRGRQDLKQQSNDESPNELKKEVNVTNNMDKLLEVPKNSHGLEGRISDESAYPQLESNDCQSYQGLASQNPVLVSESCVAESPEAAASQRQSLLNHSHAVIDSTRQSSHQISGFSDPDSNFREHPLAPDRKSASLPPMDEITESSDSRRHEEKHPLVAIDHSLTSHSDAFRCLSATDSAHLSQNATWSNLPVPTPSHGNMLPNTISSMEYSAIFFQKNAMPPRNDIAQPQIRSYLPVESTQPAYPVDSSRQPLFHVDQLGGKFPMNNQQERPLAREDWLSQSAKTETPQIMDSLPSLGRPLAQGNIVRPQSVPFPEEQFPTSSSFARGSFQSRFLSPEAPPYVKDLPYSNHQSTYWQQRASSGTFSSTLGGPRTVLTSIDKLPSEMNLPSLISNVGLTKTTISTHYNPFASTFENGPTYTKFEPVGFPGSRLTASPVKVGRQEEKFLPNVSGYALENAEILAKVPKQIPVESDASAPYDPLFDSLELSSDRIKVHVQSLPVADAGSSLSNPLDAEHGKKHKRDLVPEPKSEVDDFGEVGIDADVDVAENDSPQLVDAKDWSPGIPVDFGNTGAGEIEIDQVRSPGKSKKNKDSRSMKLFKVAIANFVKEVLKPSWRQGNMSKEAFKTIVKKTVDKVSGAMASHRLPKSQAKINQYVESSQRKLTKLVMGYVDKYVKM